MRFIIYVHITTMHVHAYNHLLTFTIATVTDRAPHQPWPHGSPDPHALAHHVPQAYRSMQDPLPRRCGALFLYREWLFMYIGS